MKHTPLKRKTPLHRYTPLRSYTPLRKIGKRGKVESAKHRKLKAELMLELPVDSQGRKICPKCLQLPDFRGFEMRHEISKGRVGKTDRSNCEIRCARCHYGPDTEDGGHDHHEKFASPMWSNHK